MRIDTLTHPGKLYTNIIGSMTVIVVDVLRATSCIITAVANGAVRVIPADDPGYAAAIANRLGSRECILAGERGGLKLADFDIGNSPSEYSRETVDGKTVIISTTNGTSAINCTASAKTVLIGAMINRTAVAKRALELGNDILILCAGTDGTPSADDICAAGSIAEAISRLATVPVQASDMTMMACMIYADWREGRADLSVTRHYSRLLSMGFEADLEYCFREDITEVVPTLDNGVIKAMYN